MTDDAAKQPVHVSAKAGEGLAGPVVPDSGEGVNKTTSAKAPTTVTAASLKSVGASGERPLKVKKLVYRRKPGENLPDPKPALAYKPKNVAEIPQSEWGQKAMLQTSGREQESELWFLRWPQHEPLWIVWCRGFSILFLLALQWALGPWWLSSGWDPFQSQQVVLFYVVGLLLSGILIVVHFAAQRSWRLISIAAGVLIGLSMCFANLMGWVAYLKTNYTGWHPLFLSMGAFLAASFVYAPLTLLRREIELMQVEKRVLERSYEPEVQPSEWSAAASTAVAPSAGGVVEVGSVQPVPQTSVRQLAHSVIASVPVVFLGILLVIGMVNDRWSPILLPEWLWNRPCQAAILLGLAGFAVNSFNMRWRLGVLFFWSSNAVFCTLWSLACICNVVTNVDLYGSRLAVLLIGVLLGMSVYSSLLMVEWQTRRVAGAKVEVILQDPEEELIEGGEWDAGKRE